MSAASGISGISPIPLPANIRSRSSPACLLHEILSQTIGAPATDGTRQPFMAGYYKARAEISDKQLTLMSGQLLNSGSGSATLTVTGTPYNDVDTNFIVQAETTGEIATATIRGVWTAATPGKRPVWFPNPALTRSGSKNGLSIYFTYGTGNDLVAGDTFTFTAYARRTTYIVAGAPFSSISNVYLNGVEIFSQTVNLSTGEINLVGNSGFVDARVVKSTTSNPIDIISAILNLAGVDLVC